MRPGKQNARAGFSLPELMAGLVGAAILVLTAGVMLYAVFDTMKDDRVELDLQRDITAAMQLWDNTLRPANRFNVTLSSNQVTFGSERFLLAQSNLVYDPDTTASGDELVIIKGRVAAFTPVITNRKISLRLSVRSGNVTSVVSSAVAYRN